MSAIPAEMRLTSPWRQALPAIVLLWAALLLVYGDTALAMVEIWSRSDTFAHAFLVPPISLWLVWRRRSELARIEPRVQPWLLLPIALIAAVWLMAELVAVNAAAQFALVGMLVLAVPAVLGRQVAKAAMFPLLFLFFAVPFGEFMLPAMMQWTADFAVLALQWTGVPVYREGLWFVIPSGTWSVIDECSGVRYLIASFMVGTLFAYLNYRSYLRRAIFMVVSLVVPIVANWLRAYLIVMMAHLSDNKIAVGVDHLLYGWVFFGIVIFLMFIIGARWSEPEAPRAAAAPDALPFGAAGTAPGASSWPTLATALAIALVALLPSLAISALEKAEGRASPVRLELPLDLASGWSAVEGEAVDWTPKFVNASATARRSYAGADGVVGVYVAYYRGQDRERKLVSSQNVLIGMKEPSWNLLTGSTTAVSIGEQQVQWRTARLLARGDAAGRRTALTIWRNYWVDGRFIAGDAAAKLAGAWARLGGRGNEGAIVVLHTEGEATAASNAVLEAFVRANSGVLGTWLQQVRNAR